ncbi:MAG: hypothetical protein HY237_13175 [Acidobacteria bacterium]|nr:hypothetical protein [Acidobacteriota bacterium]
MALPVSGFADTPWDKPPQQWKLAETYQILTDSPWAPSKTQIDVGWVPRRVDPLTKQKTDLPIYPQGGDLKVSTDIGRRTQLPVVSVLWWSAKTVRLAQQRLRQLRYASAAGEPLRADELNDFVIVVEGVEPLRILRDAVENLRETVFLELPNGMPLDLAEIRFVDGQMAGEDFVAFHFPRQIEGRVTLNPDAEKVVFHCKATAKAARPSRSNALSIRAVFEPRKMRAAGQPDL